MKCISVKFIILSIVLLLMQSCIKDDYSECEDYKLQLRFRYTLNNQYSDLFSSEVQQVTVYIFDAEGLYVGRFSESIDKLENHQIMAIPLPKGNYQAVAFCDDLKTFSAGWVDNLLNFSNELQVGVTNITDFRVMLNNTKGENEYLIPESVPGGLYAGYVDEVPSTSNADQITDVDLMKDTKNVVVKISGLSLLTSAGIFPDMYITAVNGRYRYDNSIDTSHGMMKYMPHDAYVKENILNGYLKTMRLVIKHAPMLVIKLSSDSESVFNRDITELILSTSKYKSQEDIDREDTFVFEINFSQADNDVVISVTINGWKINIVTPVND